ncbi:MAG: amino acid adenylation domain-containing protein [Steroidobacteraceae bacterium]
MASTQQWLSDLRDAGVCFEVTPDGRLRYSAPPGTLTGAQLDELRARKHEVIDCLNCEGDSTPDADIREASARLAPATSTQKGMWFLEQLGNIGAAYHLPMTLLIEEPVRIPVLERALNELVARHEALRTTLHDLGGELQQRIHPAGLGVPTLTICDMTGIAQATRDRWVREQIDAPFDLERGPLFRASLLQTAEQVHTLVLSMHHVICDGWSAGILRRELVQLYDAFSAGQAPPPRAPATQLAEFALWERSWMRGSQRQAEFAYWKQQLRNLPQQLELPYDRARPQVPSHRGAYTRLDFEPELVKGIERLQREQQATPFMIVLAAFQITLARCSGQSDIVVGSPVAVRSRPQTESIVGPLVNAVLFRTQIDRNASFAETLQCVRRMSLEAFAHHRLPFDALVEQLSPERRGQQPLMQVMFSWNQRDAQASVGRAVRFSPLFVPSSFAKLDLSLYIFDTPLRDGVPRALEAGIEFATDLFDESTIERLLAQMKILLRSCVDDPARPVWQLPVMDAHARAQLITEWNLTHHPVMSHSFVRAFGAMAAAIPRTIAVKDGLRTLTYAELDTQSSRLANYLRSRGVDRETIVALLLPRSSDAVVAILGVLKAGGAYLPLDPNHPGERLRYMIENTRATSIVTTQRLALRLPQTEATVIQLDAGRDEIEREPSTIPAVAILPANLAYVIYTSGSTGRPKGVMISHAALMNYVSFAIDAYGVGDAQGAPVTTSLCFDATVTSLLTPLLAGTAVHFAADVEDDVDALTAMLAVARPYSLLKVTPAHLELMRHTYAPSDLTNQARVVVIGGEALQATTIAHWREHSPQVRLINEYGPTETVVGCAIHEVTRRSAYDGAIPIGRPIWNTQLYVLDTYLEPVPIGVAGELFIAGAGIARGYANQPKLTAERFLPDPFGPPGARMYRTGDRVRRFSTGELDFIGRTDHQVKLRGYRIEIGEVEAALLGHEDVAQAIAVLREDAPGDKRLVGYLVARESRTLDLESVLTHAAKRLPDYMLPSAFVVLASLPLTTNGKVDRKALPAPTAAGASAGFCAPRTRLEAIVAAEWASALRLHQVGIHDDFFRLGGHSLLAARIVAKLRERTGAEVPLRWIFDAATVAGLAALIETAAPRNPGRREHSIVPRAPDVAIPLSFEQEQLWFLEKLGLSGSAYNVPLALRLEGALDIEALALSFEVLVRRHEILRTRFPEQRGSPIQVVDPAGEVSLMREHLANAHDIEEQVRARVRLEMLHEFNVEHGPLVRASLLQLGPQEHVLCLNMHHLICDGATLRILLGDLSQFYCAVRERRAVALDPRDIQYADYAAWQRSPSRLTKLADSLAYWRGRLDGAPLSLDLPTDGRRSIASGAVGAVESFAIREAVGIALAGLTQTAGVTPFMMLLGAYAILLSRWSAQNDIVIGCPVSGRSRPEVQDVAGYFVNTLPLRVTLGRVSFHELVQQIREIVVEAFAYQDVPLIQLATALHAVRDPTRHPLFQVMLVVEDTSADDPLQIPGIRTSAIDAGWLTAKADLTLSVKLNGSSIVGRIEYATTMFEARTVRELGRQWAALLADIAVRPDVPIDELSLLGDGDRERLLALGRGGELHVRSDATTVHGLFEVQAATRPTAVAASLGTRHLTYADLNARANQLAHALRAAGVTAETPVAICLDRSLDLVVAILAVLKSGGAYVPIDPAYPTERIVYMLEDSGSAVLVMTSGCAVAGITAQRVLHLEREAGAIARHPVTNPPPLTGSNHLLYRLYTSGSTGRPKGTDITHDNVVRLFAATASWLQFSADDVWTLFHSYAFDFSVWEIFGALLHGGRLVIVPSDTARSPEIFHRLLLDEGVTVLNQTPSAFRQLQVVAEGTTPDRRLDRLRYVIFGGEALQPAALSSWFAVYGATGPRLINMYGITETTVHVTFRPITPRDLDSPCRSPMGIPIPDLELHLLGPNLEPVAINCTGELYVAGAGLSRGYHRRPALTAERFVPHSHARTPGERLYRTGDLARRRANGKLEYLGRADGQVKLRGYRIELQEIERCMIRTPQVAEAVAHIRGADEHDRRIVAWVVAKPGELVDVAALRAQLTTTLPAFMIPAEFMVLEKMPLTANGKLDHRNLPEPSGQRWSQTQYAPPRTVTERVLASVWEECLGIDRVGIDDNFFACGGDSIRAVQLVYQAREHGVHLTVALLFARQSIRELAPALDEVDRSLVSHQPVDVQAIALPAPRGSSHAYPLSAMQEVMVREYARHAATGRGVYHVQQLFHFTDESPFAEAMCNAFAALAQAHPILRTHFVRQSNGGFIQVVAKSIDLPFVERAPLDLSIEEEQQHGLEAMRSDRMRPFALDGTAVPWRAQWMRTAADRFALLLSIHHAIDDGWGNQQMLSQLFDFYARAKRGDALDPERRPNVFMEFVALERELRESAESERFWRSRELPLSGAAVRASSHFGGIVGDGDEYKVALDDATMRKLRALARRSRLQLKAVLLNAYVEALCLELSLPRLTVGVVTNGRSARLSDALNTLGLFWTMLPLPVTAEILAERGPARMRAIHDLLASAEPHAMYPATGAAGCATLDEMFFATFNFTDFHNATELGDGRVLRLRSYRGFDRFHYPLNYLFAVDRRTQRLFVHVEFDDRCFDRDGIRRITDRILAGLDECTRAEP